jgi:hypothetical protein
MTTLARLGRLTVKPAPTPLALAALAALAVPAVLAASGCAPQEWEPSAVGPLADDQAGVASAPAELGSMNGDMVSTPRSPGEPAVQSALSSGSHGSGDPKVFYLFYADGSDLPKTDINACKGTPPKFTCTFAPTLAECQRQIQAYLDRWFADFNIIFTLTRPTSGAFYTEVVSSGGGAWCGVDNKVAGVAPFLCKDINGGVSYTFLGGDSAKQTAVIIAQEQAHLVGLEHTKSTHDLMYPTICQDCDGFVDDDLPIDGDRCDRKTQNSYQMMKDRLGAWPGGPKPSAFGCMSDDATPSVKILEPADGATVGATFSVKVDARDDCDLAKVDVTVSPLALHAESKAPPFEWELTNMSGQQTIVVTATDGAGHTATTSVTVTAPADTAASEDQPAPAAGCTVASSAFSLSGLLPSLAMLLFFPRRRRAHAGARPARRRMVTGALRRGSAPSDDEETRSAA